MNQLPAATFDPLDPDAEKHDVLLVRSRHRARPVLVNGVQGFVQDVHIVECGGGTKSTVYIKGDPKEYDAADIKIATTPQ